MFLELQENLHNKKFTRIYSLGGLDNQGWYSQGIPFMTWTVKTGAQIHGYLLGLKSIKTLIVGLQKI